MLDKIAELRAEIARLKALATAITEKPELTPADRKLFDEYVSLAYEIEDYVARLQRHTEKWKCYP